MKRILFEILRLIRRLHSKFYTFLFKRMLHSYGSVGVNGFCRVSQTAKVDVGEHFSSNGLTISGLGGESGGLFSFW